MEVQLYPLNLKLAGEPCVVVGGGEIALRKSESLLGCGARIRLIAPELHPELESLPLEVEQRPYRPGDLEGARLVICATDDPAVNRAVYEEARRLGILVNVVDVPDLCDFYVPAVVRRGSLQLTVSTGGRCPGLSARLRRRLEGEYGPEWEPYVELMEEVRSWIQERMPGPSGPRMNVLLKMLEIPVPLEDLTRPEGLQGARAMLREAVERETAAARGGAR